MSPFPSLSSQAGEEQGRSMSESPAAEHLINLPSGKQGSPTLLPGKKAGIVQPGPRYATGSVCTKTQTRVLWARLLRQPGLTRDCRFPPRQAPENCASDSCITQE